MKLATQPTVTVSGHAGTDLTLDKTMLTFTVDSWDTAQTVTVKAGHDDDAANDTATLTHTASGGDYAGIIADLPVTVTDDDSGHRAQRDGPHRDGGRRRGVDLHSEAGHPALRPSSRSGPART